MSFWTDAATAFRDLALLKDKLDRALVTAEYAKAHSIENRERITRIETTLGFIIREQDAQRRLPPQ